MIVCTLLLLKLHLVLTCASKQNVLPQLRRYDTSQPNLAFDVKAYLTTSATAASMLTNKNKADRKSLVEMITHYQLMAGLIRLFEIDPMLAFAAPPQVCIQFDCIRQYFEGGKGHFTITLVY